MASRKKILFICGTKNQTTMMHKISNYLGDHDCWFTPYYTDGLLARLERRGTLDFTIAGNVFRRFVFEYCQEHHLAVDDRGERHAYDLVVTCSDLVVQRNIRHRKIILVQEGMTDPENLLYYLSKYLGLPRYLASTSTTGLSHAYVRFCVASEGYRQLFTRKGVDPSKIVVTGIPNFDNCIEYYQTPFEHRDYVLVATSDARETFKYENRRRFIEDCRRIADGRQLIFKLHPNEQVDRATREIRHGAPDALVYHGCDIHHMIAHCDTLVTKYSTSVYIGIVLGKTVHSYFPLSDLQRLAPMQNGGTSALRIADVCRDIMERMDLVIPVQLGSRWRRSA
jgi:hypothetical protein